MRKVISFVFIPVLMVAAALAGGPSVGKISPEFSLLDTNGQTVSLKNYRGKYVVLEWTNYSCPFVRKHYQSGNMQALQKEETAQGVVWLSINSSAAGKEGNMSPDEWKSAIKEKGAAPTTVLLDGDGKVGKMYGATNTPHMFVIDPKGVLIYKGAIDDKPTTDPEDVKGAHNYVRAALAEAMAGKPV